MSRKDFHIRRVLWASRFERGPSSAPVRDAASRKKTSALQGGYRFSLCARRGFFFFGGFSFRLALTRFSPVASLSLARLLPAGRLLASALSVPPPSSPAAVLVSLFASCLRFRWLYPCACAPCGSLSKDNTQYALRRSLSAKPETKSEDRDRR